MYRKIINLMCLVHSWKARLETICEATWLSQISLIVDDTSNLSSGKNRFNQTYSHGYLCHNSILSLALISFNTRSRYGMLLVALLWDKVPISRHTISISTSLIHYYRTQARTWIVLTRTSHVVVCVIALYSGLALDQDTICCFLLFCETSFPSTYTQYPLIDLMCTTIRPNWHQCILSSLCDHNFDIAHFF